MDYGNIVPWHLGLPSEAKGMTDSLKGVGEGYCNELSPPYLPSLLILLFEFNYFFKDSYNASVKNLHTDLDHPVPFLLKRISNKGS